MSVAILTLNQFHDLVSPNQEPYVWADNQDLFTGITLILVGRDNSPTGKSYFSEGVFYHDSEEWLESLSEQNQIDALFKLDQWRNTDWAKEINPDILLDQEFDLYLSSNKEESYCMIKLNDRIFQIIEDEDDGYRSSLNKVIEFTVSVEGFEEVSSATVKVEVDPDTKGSNFDGWRIVDTKTHFVWFRFGTDNSGDYYPWFVFDANRESQD